MYKDLAGIEAHADRFWEKVAKGEPDECWNWTSTVIATGYGHFWFNRTFVRAHRVAKYLTDGKLSTEICVLHTCDNRACCNPAHLFTGTYRDNAVDMREKGRGYQLSSQEAREMQAKAVEARKRNGNY